MSESNVCDQHCATRYGPPFHGGLRPELLGIDQPHSGADRVDGQSLPGQVQEGEPRHDGEVHPGVEAQQLDGALGHQGRARNGVDDRCRSQGPRRVDEHLDDRHVDLLEGGGRLVEVIERDEGRQALGPRVTRRAQERPAGLGHEGSDLVGQVLRASGPETDHGDPGAGSSHRLWGLPARGARLSLAGRGGRAVDRPVEQVVDEG